MRQWLVLLILISFGQILLPWEDAAHRRIPSRTNLGAVAEDAGFVRTTTRNPTKSLREVVRSVSEAQHATFLEHASCGDCSKSQLTSWTERRPSLPLRSTLQDVATRWQV